MKMKIILFMTFLLAVASLGLAFPQKKPLTPTLVPTPVPTTAPTSPAPSAQPFSSSDDVAKALGISPQCASAIFSIVISPEFLKCIPIPAFVPLIPIVTDPAFIGKLLADPAGTFKKIEPPLVEFSTVFCKASKCSDDGINKAIKILSDGCKTDLEKNQLIQLVFALTVFYSPLHDSVCFRDEKAGKFCWDESLTTIFNLPKSPIKIIDGGLIDSIAVSDPFAVCTKCNKDIINTFGNFIPNNKLALAILAKAGVDQKALDLLHTGIAVKCGIKFEDGKIPDKPPK